VRLHIWFQLMQIDEKRSIEYNMSRWKRLCD